MQDNESVDLDVIADEEALWRLVTTLASAVTPFEVAEAFTKEGALAAGGSFANMAMLGDQPDLVQVVHRPVFNPQVVAQRGMFDLGADTPACGPSGPDCRCSWAQPTRSAPATPSCSVRSNRRA